MMFLLITNGPAETTTHDNAVGSCRGSPNETKNTTKIHANDFDFECSEVVVLNKYLPIAAVTVVVVVCAPER